MNAHRYLHLDVFTDSPFSGNQLAVFPDATDLDAQLMQRMAMEMAFSETTFVFPAESDGTDARVRIFTPHPELPMAGHPTIGTAFALAHEGRVGPNRDTVTFGLGSGPTRVGLEWDSGRLAFAWMTQAAPEFGAAPADPPGLAKVLAVDGTDLESRLPAQVVSSGVPFLFVPLATRRAVDAAALDRPAWQAFCAAAQLPELPVFVFSLQGGDDDATAYSRMFAPVFGIAEDAATGGASGPLGGYLLRHGAVTIDRAAHMVSLQGVKRGRPSRVHISVNTRNGLIDSVRVGGQAVVVAEGTLRTQRRECGAGGETRGHLAPGTRRWVRSGGRCRRSEPGSARGSVLRPPPPSGSGSAPVIRHGCGQIIAAACNGQGTSGSRSSATSGPQLLTTGACAAVCRRATLTAGCTCIILSP